MSKVMKEWQKISKMEELSHTMLLRRDKPPLCLDEGVRHDETGRVKLYELWDRRDESPFVMTNEN